MEENGVNDDKELQSQPEDVCFSENVQIGFESTWNDHLQR